MIALHIIAKDEVDQIQRIVRDYEDYFDEIAIAYDSDLKDLEAIKCKTPEKLNIHSYKWVNDFADKRNFLADRTKADVYFRMDTDDIIIHPERIREIYDRMIKHKMDVVYVPYVYSRDEDGNCNAEQWRETFITKKPSIYWKKKVHENIFVDDPSTYRGIKETSLWLIHDITEEHVKESAERNFNLLMEEFSQDKENTDPRTIAYIGRMLMGFGEWKKAISFLEILINKSGWDDDKYFAWVEVARCYQRLNDIPTAIAACNEALAIRTDYPDAYSCLCECYLEKKDYKKALDWITIASTKGKPDTMIVLDPTRYGYRIDMLTALALYGIGDYEKAKKFYDKALEQAPKDEFVVSQKDIFHDAFRKSEAVKNIFNTFFYIRDTESSKMEDFVRAIPSNLFMDERIQSLRNQILPEKTWDDKSVVIYADSGLEPWGPPSVIKGIGGSEEAIIYLSKELVKLGWKVTVFNDCGDFAGEYEGVEYRNSFEFNPRDNFNYLISWRYNIFKYNNLKAKKKILWLHDVPIGLEREAVGFDKVLVLSQFHKSLLPPNIPEEKIIVSANGINTPDFKDYKLERNPRRMIYTSSYDRGIQHLLEMWPDIRKEVPDAELHLFYGWETYDILMEKGHRPKEFKAYLNNLINQEGITDHGKVGHKQLIKEFQKSGLWVYPSHFEEISCISAMKAQACGCVPVVIDYAALKETVKHGVKVEGKAGPGVNPYYKEQLINILKKPDLQEDFRKNLGGMKDYFGWDKVARQWTDEVLTSD